MKKYGTMFAAALLCLVFCVPVTAAEKKDRTKTDEVKEITISAVGDCTLGSDSRYNQFFINYYRKNDAAYFLKKVKPIFEKDDITIANFEGTLTDSTNRARKEFTFKGPAQYASILTEGSVEVVNLANNHSADFGRKGLNDTKRTLKKYGIPFCMQGTIAYKTVQGVKVAFLGFNKLDHVSDWTVKKTIQKAKKNGAGIVIVSFHWGIELDKYPNAREIKAGRAAIDNGASLVLGHHPHILQGIERYKGRYIVYSLGNFCFGGNSNPRDKDTMIFQQTFYVKDGELQSKRDAKVIPCSLSSSGRINDFQPKPLKGKEKDRVIRKINTLSKGKHTSAKADGSLK